MTIPTITIDPGYFLEIGSLPAPLMMWRLFLDGAWLPVLVVFVYGAWLLWVQWRQLKFNKTIQTVLLAIDVPKTNEQTPKAVEQIFAQLAGAYSGLDRYEKYWLGKTQGAFSLEIVSMEGYVQFLVHTWKKYRDLVEAAFYAQYPEAEITEIQDYTGVIPHRYPDPEWDIWGTEFVLKKPYALPIRTYLQFEHVPSEEYFKSPLSPLLEVMGSVRRGEFLWMQLLIAAGDDSWKDAGKAFVDKMLGKQPVAKKSAVDTLMEAPAWWLAEVRNQALGGEQAEAKKPEKKDESLKMLNLTPGERNVIEAVQLKASKTGFATKIRLIYCGRRGVFSKGRVSQFKGALGVFGAQDMNAFKPFGKVSPKEDYFYERWYAPGKKNRILRYYINRSGRGATPYYLNTEELATLYHFPFQTSKAPMIKKTEAKRSEPPARLPMTEDDAGRNPFLPAAKKAPPPALPGSEGPARK